MITVDLPPEAEAELGVLAERRGMRLSDYLRLALIEHVETLSDIADAEKALDDIRSGRSGTTTLDEVERELGLAS